MHTNNLIDDDLYRQIILDHYSRPRHNCHLENPTITTEGNNPTCGDEIELDLKLENGVITDVGFVGEGCSISVASSSMLADTIKGKPIEEVLKIAHAFKARLLSHENEEAAKQAEEVDIGELEALDGVKDYPVRIKCALLSWNTLLSALETGQEVQ
ncbi:MAG: Fe-S cluster assembly sulfur transfer protein SufU [Candidatus Bruticola sp.]